MSNFFKKITLNKKATLKEALEHVEASGSKCLYVVENNRLIGSITDGDIRRAILKNVKLSEKITNFFNKKPKFLTKENYSIPNAKKIFLKYKIDTLPITSKGKIIGNINWRDLFKLQKNKKNQSVFILAGGEGQRLKPFTMILPKPLIPINGVPVIKKIIDSFDHENTNNIFISLNYKNKIIKSYLNSEIKKHKLFFIKEQKPLGTIGSLSLINEKKLMNNLVITFCDILFENKMDNVMIEHEKNNNDLTIVVSKKIIKNPYGVCKINNNAKFIKIDEKPEEELFINVGYYIIKKSLIKLIPKNKSFNMTDLIKKIKKLKFKIGIYPIPDNKWYDVGEWHSYKHTIENFQNEK